MHTRDARLLLSPCRLYGADLPSTLVRACAPPVASELTLCDVTASSNRDGESSRGAREERVCECIGARGEEVAEEEDETSAGVCREMEVRIMRIDQ